MLRNVALVVGLAIPLFVTGCATKPAVIHKDYTLFRQLDPHSILIVPAINRSVDVDAPDYLLSTISRPVAERGYYVFPVHLVKRLLEDDGLADANLVHESDPTKLASMFGADAILYVTIERWDARYSVITTKVTVEFSYVLKSGTTGQELWRSTEKMVYQPQGGQSGSPLADLIVDAIEAAITRARPNYIPLAQQANAAVVLHVHQGLPAGPHHPKYQQDSPEF